MNNEQTLFVIADPAKCTGCRACEVACFAGHRTCEKAKTARTVGTVTCPVIPRLFLSRQSEVTCGVVKGADGKDIKVPLCMPIQCHHCEDAPCVRSCQAGALKKNENGTVLLDERKCIGCKNCALACPFGAIQVFSKDEITIQPVCTCSGGTATTTAAAKLTPKLVFKCDFCVNDAAGPACVKTCPNEALRIVEPEIELLKKRTAAVEAAAICNTQG